MLSLIVGSVLPWLLLAVGSWLGFQLVRQNGRILLQLESIERRLQRRAKPPKQKVPGGLPIGTPAPDFELPDLSGTRCKLSEFRHKNLLLVFFNPKCGFCTKMAADLAALPTDGTDGRPLPVVVTTGNLEENRQLMEQHGIRCVVLLQEQMEVASRFDVHGTPMGYRIDGEGRIASQLAAGAEPLLKLAGSAAPPRARARQNGKPSRRKYQKDDPSLARSRLNRNGLKAGTPAPEFTLPHINGGELSLAEFRGKRVLLVFSSPDCGPCDEIAPRLQEMHSNRSDICVLVVSRGDLQANRAKAGKLGLSYPIVLQKQWEISLKYAMFATPIGYLIDEAGIIVRDVAVGVQPILDMANEPTPTSYEFVKAEHDSALSVAAI